MKKKLCIVLSMFAFVSVNLLCAPVPPPPPAPGAQSGFRPSGTRSNVRRQLAQEENPLDPQLDAAVATLIDSGSQVIGGYIESASNRVRRALGPKPKRNESIRSSQLPTESVQPSQETEATELAADNAMLNNSAQVGDDTVDLLLARDKEEWKAFIDKQFQENTKALVETLIPLYQFHPDDVRELSQYIADKKDALAVRNIVKGTANTTDWVVAQQAIEDTGASTSFIDSPEARAIARELKGRFTGLVQEKVKRLEKAGERAADRKAESQWDKIRSDVWGNQ